MTNRETLRAAIDDINSNGGVSSERWHTILLTSIADSLAIIADVLTDKYKAESEDKNEI